MELDTVKEIVEVDSASEADRYLEKGWVLLATASGHWADSGEPHLKYALGWVNAGEPELPNPYYDKID